MNYQTYRELAVDGEIIFFKAMTLGQKIIARPTGGEFSHTGIVFWATTATGCKRLMLAESTHGGVRVVPLSVYRGRPFEAMNIGLDWAQVEETAFAETGTVNYSNIDLLMLGIKRVFGINMPNTPGEVCSEFVGTLIALDKNYRIDTFVDPNTLHEECLPYAHSITKVK